MLFIITKDEFEWGLGKIAYIHKETEKKYHMRILGNVYEKTSCESMICKKTLANNIKTYFPLSPAMRIIYDI